MKKRKPQKFPVLILVIGGLLLIVAAALLLTQNKTDQAIPISLVSSGHDEETYPEIERVSLSDAKAALDAGSAIFVDVRSADAYAVNHIPGALNLPLGELESRLGELDPNQWILTYCT